MFNKSVKIIFLVTVIVTLLTIIFSMINNLGQKQYDGWIDLDGFNLSISKNKDFDKELINEIERRLYQYDDWVQIIVTNEIDEVSLSYLPYLASTEIFNKSYKLYNSVDIVSLLENYSDYIEYIFFNNDQDFGLINDELNKIQKFSIHLDKLFKSYDYATLEELLNIISSNSSFFHNYSLYNYQISIILKNDIPFSEHILNQFKKSLLEIKKIKKFDFELKKSQFQSTEIDTLKLLKDNANFSQAVYTHVYKMIPKINKNQFNYRRSLLASSVFNKESNDKSISMNFIASLSRIEEQLIELQYRSGNSENYFTDKINFLVGDGEQDIGLLTILINNMYENDSAYKIDDIFKISEKILTDRYDRYINIIYPFTTNLNLQIIKKYFDIQMKALVFKIK